MSEWRALSAEDLSLAYNARATVGGDISAYLETYAARSAAARAALEVEIGVAYGPSAAETFDFFPAIRADGAPAPLHLFIHGGYWRALSKDVSAFAAPAFVRNGIAFAALDYALCPTVRLSEIVRQCRAAVAHLVAGADRFGIDPTRITVSGSSAGAHLTAMLLAGDGWEDGFGLPVGAVRAGVAVSGLFDLEPVRHCDINEVIGLDAAEAEAMSPLGHVAPRGRRLVVAWGETETAEFKRQSLDYAARWVERGGMLDAFEVPGRNHFDVILDLADPHSRLGRAALAAAGP